MYSWIKKSPIETQTLNSYIKTSTVTMYMIFNIMMREFPAVKQ